MDDADWSPHHSEAKTGEKPNSAKRGPKKKRKLGRPESGEKPKKRRRISREVTTLAFRRNDKKLQLLQQFDDIQKSGSADPDAEFARRNPSVPLKTLKSWQQPENRCKSRLTASRKGVSVMLVSRLTASTNITQPNFPPKRQHFSMSFYSVEKLAPAFPHNGFAVA